MRTLEPFQSLNSAQLLRAGVVNDSQRNQVVDLIQQLIDALSSADIAIDEKHTPKLYARFLRSLLSEQLADGEDEEMTHETPGTEGSSNPPQELGDSADRSSTETDSKTQKQDSKTPPQRQNTNSAQHDGHITPSISLEFAPIGGEPHVQVLQDHTGRPPQLTSDYMNLGNLGSYPAYEERFSNASSTIGGRLDDCDVSTQHGGSIRENGIVNGHITANEKLAYMHLLSNPQFFDHMMMPPYNPANWGQPQQDYGTIAAKLHESSRNFYQTQPQMIDNVYLQ